MFLLCRGLLGYFANSLCQGFEYVRVVFCAMGEYTSGAVLYASFGPCGSSRTASKIQRTIAEQAVEVLGGDILMARKVAAITITKKTKRCVHASLSEYRVDRH